MQEAQKDDPLGIVGQTIDGKYLVQALIGEGGAAAVYRARNVEWDLDVAIKFYLAFATAPLDARDKLLEEFVQEGRLMSKLSSRSSAITQPRDMGAFTRHDGAWIPYLVLEWLEGSPLDYVLVAETSQGIPPRSLEQTIALLEPAASALEIAHRENIVHRDVKPENLFVLGDPRGPSPRLKVFDFGIAKIMQESIGIYVHTAASATPFTPHYGAPEQFSRSYGTTGPWTDVFALALVVLEVMRGGERVFAGNDFVELSLQSRSEDVRPTPRVLGMTVSDDVEAVFARALALRPQDRYPSAGDFWQALYGAVYPQRGMWKTELSTAPPSIDVTAARSEPLGAGAAGTKRGGSRAVVFGAFAIGAVLIAGAAYLGARKLHGPAEGASPVSSATRPATTASAAAPNGSPSAPTASSSSSASAAAMPATLCADGAIAIPGGSYTIGDDDSDRAKPEHRVYLDSYCIDAAEVTASAYAACVAGGACKEPVPTLGDLAGRPAGDAKSCNFGPAARANDAVSCVSFDDAAAYCASKKERLPTEAEWEAAARQSKFDPSSVAVAEWMSDFFAPYSADAQVNPKGPRDGAERVVRGARLGGASAAPLSERASAAASLRHPALGFRCASSIGAR